jgi:predicted nucleotidyltransferase
MGMSKTQIETFKPPSADDPVLGEVVRRLSEVYHPLQIYLFGSAARGDAGPDSDYDIMVVVPDDTPADLQRSRRGYPGDHGSPERETVHSGRRGELRGPVPRSGV